LRVREQRDDFRRAAPRHKKASAEGLIRIQKRETTSYSSILQLSSKQNVEGLEKGEKLGEAKVTFSLKKKCGKIVLKGYQGEGVDLSRGELNDQGRTFFSSAAEKSLIFGGDSSKERTRKQRSQTGEGNWIPLLSRKKKAIRARTEACVWNIESLAVPRA